MILNFNKYSYIKEGKILDFLEFGNAKDKRLPKTHDEVKYDVGLSQLAIQLYDSIFGTKYLKKYGNNLTLLVKDPTIKDVTSGDVISKLIDMSYLPNVYSNFDIKISEENRLEELLLKQIMNSYQNKDTSVDDILDYFKKIPSKSRKKKFLYDMYLDYGNNFDKELIRKVFDIKRKKNLYHYRKELKDIPKMNIDLEKSWLKCIKWSMDHYKDYFNTSEMLERAFNKMLEITTRKEKLVFGYIDNQLEIFKDRLKEYTSS